jgi:hypothetical protein
MADRAAEIALARSAAPESIAREAEVLVLGRNGFETAVKGKNGFVCVVGRSWTSTVDAEFWNPKVRVPMWCERGSRAFLPSARHQRDRVGTGGTHAGTDE